MPLTIAVCKIVLSTSPAQYIMCLLTVRLFPNLVIIILPVLFSHSACKRYVLSQQSYLHPPPTSIPLTPSVPIPGSIGGVNSVKFHESPPQASALSPVITSKRSRRKSPLFPVSLGSN